MGYSPWGCKELDMIEQPTLLLLLVLPPFISLPQSQDGPSSLVPTPWAWSCEDPSLVPENHFLELERHEAESPCPFMLLGPKGRALLLPGSDSEQP